MVKTKLNSILEQSMCRRRVSIHGTYDWVATKLMLPFCSQQAKKQGAFCPVVERLASFDFNQHEVGCVDHHPRVEWEQRIAGVLQKRRRLQDL